MSEESHAYILEFFSGPQAIRNTIRESLQREASRRVKEHYTFDALCADLAHQTDIPVAEIAAYLGDRPQKAIKKQYILKLVETLDYDVENLLIRPMLGQRYDEPKQYLENLGWNFEEQSPRGYGDINADRRLARKVSTALSVQVLEDEYPGAKALWEKQQNSEEVEKTESIESTSVFCASDVLGGNEAVRRQVSEAFQACIQRLKETTDTNFIDLAEVTDIESPRRVRVLVEYQDGDEPMTEEEFEALTTALDADVTHMMDGISAGLVNEDNVAEYKLGLEGLGWTFSPDNGMADDIKAVTHFLGIQAVTEQFPVAEKLRKAKTVGSR